MARAYHISIFIGTDNTSSQHRPTMDEEQAGATASDEPGLHPRHVLLRRSLLPQAWAEIRHKHTFIARCRSGPPQAILPS